MVKEKTATASNAKPVEKQAVCMKKGGGRYFLIHRLSQMKKRNPNKEIQNRMKEIDRLMLYSV
jgi:hypothetical protein